MQKKLTINLPESPETLRYLLKILSKLGLISDKKAKAIKSDYKITGQTPKSRWSEAAERLRKEGYLKGKGDEVKRLTNDFREGFDL